MAASTALAGAVGATSWTTAVAAGSKAEGAAQPAITSLTGHPTTFTAACVSGSEAATLSWSSAGTAVTGYEVWVSSSANGTYALATTQPTGTNTTVIETYTSSTSGAKYFRLEAKSANWAYPGSTVTNAREASVAGTNGGFLTMTASSPFCTATA
ncbi:MAG TPA: hypothetical protein VGS61_03765 [Acidimicrobiales bacterium]|nr:hypothetical protein [Acidimicrobiales bacterium]